MSSRPLADRIVIIATCLVGAIFFHAIFLLGELPTISYLTLADKMMISIYTIFVGNGALILLHQHKTDIAEKTHGEYDIQSQIRLDKKMLVITVAASLVVFGLLYPL